MSQSVLWKNGITVFKVKVTAKVQNVSECLSGWYLLNHRTVCYQIWYGDAALWARLWCRKFFWLLLSSRSRSQQGLIWSKYDPFCYIVWTVDSLVTKARVSCEKKKRLLHSMKVKNFTKYLCILYLLYQWSLGNQRRCADLLFIITKPNTTKWAYTDSSTLTYTITSHTMGGILWRKATNLVKNLSLIHISEPTRHQTSLASLWGQDNSEDSKVYWIFMYLVSSVLLISWQPK